MQAPPIDPNFEALAQKLSQALPPGVRAIQDDMRQSFVRLLQNAFADLNLVTREEFDVQAAVLARTREKLELLEQRLAELEKPSER